MSAQTQNLARAMVALGPAVLEFYKCRGFSQFYAEDLRRYVNAFTGQQNAPNSAYRILWELQREGKLAYNVLNRRASLYEFIPANWPKVQKRINLRAEVKRLQALLRENGIAYE